MPFSTASLERKYVEAVFQTCRITRSSSIALGWRNRGLLFVLAGIMRPNGGLDALGAGYFGPHFEAVLESDHAGFRKGDLDGFRDFRRRDPQIEGDAEVAGDVAFSLGVAPPCELCH